MEIHQRAIRADLMTTVVHHRRCQATEIVLPLVRRGRPPKVDRTFVRTDRGGEAGIVYRYGEDGKRHSLGIPGDRREDGRIAASISADAEYARMLGLLSPMDTRISVIVDYEVRKVDPGPEATVAEKQAFQSRKLKLRRIAKFFGAEAALRNVTPDACEDYGEWLLSQRARPKSQDERLMSLNTLRVDLAWLRSAINRYAKRMNLVIVNGVEVPSRPAGRQHWLTRGQVARLVASAMWGWVWDGAAGAWATETELDGATGDVRRRRKVDPTYDRVRAGERGRQIARAILIMYYTGTRSGRVRYLTWVEHPTCGFIDVDRGLIRRSGVFAPKFAGPGATKPAGAAVLPVPLLRLVRRWRRADRKRGAGVLAVITVPERDEFYSASGLYAQVKRAAERCGMRDMVVHELRHSTVTACLRAGCSSEETAAFVDMSVHMVRTVYGHLDHSGTAKGAMAMADKAYQPEHTSRELAALTPRHLLRPQDALALRTLRLLGPDAVA